jgi:hypothetical protein
MTAINNLKGHIVRDGSIVYQEELRPNLYFAVAQMYEPIYDKDNYGSSSKLWLEATITTGQTHTWSNGVNSLIEAEHFEEATENFNNLEKLKTSHGFEVWQHAYDHRSYTKDGKTIKSRKVKWLVKLSKDQLAKFLKI